MSFCGDFLHHISFHLAVIFRGGGVECDETDKKTLKFKLLGETVHVAGISHLLIRVYIHCERVKMIERLKFNIT